MTGKDTLFRAVVHAELDVLYLDSKTESKERWLEQSRRSRHLPHRPRPYPVNAVSRTSRAATRRANVVNRVARARALEPEGIIVCHGPSHRELKPAPEEAGLPLLHNKRIPLRRGNWPAAFVERYREAVRRLQSNG
ncbi:hypothetical protein GCM10011512_09590 [Tersicoccus solisilvae]|uniref:Uncharacterized protein n=1 Tax=Tersicoccus solisilvae TaxID=1882339 RepID=A0ABQ1NU36_9MICC|nr:hypothetical protein GCM10011512_09590 [Tersicoccus solisilvae]